MRPAVVCVLSALIGACGTAPGPEQLPAPPAAAVELPDRDVFVASALLAPGATRAELRERWGEPDSVIARVVPNRHVPGVVDTLFTVHHPGLIVGLHRPGVGGELLSAVTVSSNDFLRWPVIGASAAAVERELGPADVRAPERLVYHCRTCVAGDDPVELLLDGDAIVAIRFNYYVD